MSPGFQKRTGSAPACAQIQSRGALALILGESFAVIRYIFTRRAEPPPG